MTGKKLYEANHLYMMKLALIKTNLQEDTTSRYHPSIVKTTYHIKSAKKVPNFAARWRSIRKYFTHTTASNQKNDARNNNKMKNTPHAYTRKTKKKQPIKSKPL